MSVGKDGSSSYVIPIALPPGRAGMAPEISLAVHEAAQAARTAARVVTARDQSRIDLADRLLLKGHDAFAGGNVVGAADRWLRAYRAVLPLQ